MSEIASGRHDVNGKIYWDDGKGGLVPETLVRTTDKLQDEMVRKMVLAALPLAAAVAAFRDACFDDVDSFVALLAQEYGLKRGGTKGNLTFTTVDNLLKIQVQVNDVITFGPELQIAKGLVDQCLQEWAEGADDKIRAIINRAFQVDNEQQVNRASLFYLLRLEIADERWKSAMKAITDSIKATGTKRYIRIYRRADIEAPFSSITIDMAAG